ncbi:MAG: glycosyltransferase family 2 protein [Bacteroidales bacterium]|nr:glycosyltransferase family 2 protein [Bacteroidales bacterium]MCF8336528.1 glycosyltransferase family 2 protein [Bacteroidales bacterium]
MDEEQYPLVSIVTINYNHSEVTAECLESLKKITYPHIEIILVDNASPNEDASWLKEKYPYLHFIQSNKNLGFAGGNNLGIRKTIGEYILLLNNDTVVEPDFLEPLVDKCRQNPDAGAVSPKVRYHHTPEMLQYAGYTHIDKFTVRNKAVGFNQIDNGQYDKDRMTYYPIGAAMLLPRKVIEDVGLMSDIFFLYYEEMDWGYRIRKTGRKIFYVHNSLVWHKESIATGFDSPMQVYYLNRSRILYMRRNNKGLSYLAAFFYLLFISIPKNYLYYLIRRKPELLEAYHKAIFWHIKNIFNKKVHANPEL